MKIKIEFDTIANCHTCKLPLVPSTLPINSAWGTKQQVEAQGAVVAQGFYHLSGNCSKCVEGNKFIVICVQCNRPIKQSEIAVMIVEKYSEGEVDSYCKDCYAKWSKEKIKKFIQDEAEIIFPEKA